MVRRTVLALLVMGVALSCSSSGGYKGSGGVTACGNPSLRFVEPCATCLQSQCGDLISTCYGAGWRQSQFSGTCSDMLSCACNCASTDPTCVTNCRANASAACAQCMGDLTGCQST